MRSKILIYILLALFPCTAVVAAEQNEDVKSTKKERNFIREGNKLYRDKRFAEAEVEYKKAIEENVASEIASFNLAASLIRQQGSADPNSKNNPLQQATEILSNLASTARDAQIASKAFYNLGNMAFNQQKYDESIGHYKNALRRDPNDEQARQNLRLAQLKKQEQDKQNKDDKKDQDKKDDKKDQDKKDQDKKDQDKKDPQQNKPKDDGDKDKKQPQPQNGMSQNNAEQVLKTMENNEKNVQNKVNASREREERKNRQRTEKQW